MHMIRKEHPPPADIPRASPQPTYRSGAVARMVRMPVSTLRIWERRYQAVGPTIAPSGHRLYSAADVLRVALLRQLTEHGHAIGSIAALNTSQLQQVASTHVSTIAGTRAQATRRTAPLRLLVVGRALARRLQRAAVVQRLAQPPQVSAVFETLAEAAHAPAGTLADLLLWHAPSLQSSALPDMKAAQDVFGARGVAVVYRFAGAAAREAFSGAGALLVREPPDDEALGAWLASLEGTADASANKPNVIPLPPDAPGLVGGDVTARRFDDATLTEFAGLSSTIACECPRHVAELLMQLSNFEAYSADCANRSPADAELHAYLQRVAGAARGLFESALERVAVQEGLMLP